MQTFAIFAELQTADAFSERGAVAVLEAAHQFFEATSASDDVAHFEDFTLGEFFPAWTDRSSFADAAEERFDFGKRETHLAGEFDEEDAIERLGRVVALAAAAGRRGEQADFFVVADGGGI